MKELQDPGLDGVVWVGFFCVGMGTVAEL